MAEADPAAPPPGQAGIVARLTAPGAALGPFGYPAFRAMWLAYMFSQIGSMIQAVAAAWLMTELSTSHAMVAGVQAAANLPILFLAVVAGTALNGPAWQASVRAQVGARDLPTAVSLNTIANNLGRSLGPALGGLLVSLTNVATAFAVNSLSFCALIWALLWWRPDVPHPVRRPILPSIGEGLAFCAQSSPVRRVLVRSFCAASGGAGFHALLPSIVRDAARGTGFEYGLVLGAFGVGSIGGALLVTGVRRRLGAEAVVGAAALAIGLGTAMIGQQSNVWAMMPFALLVGAGWVSAMTTCNIAVQLRAPENLLGRCMSVYQAVAFGGIALGSWALGLLSDAAGLPFAMGAAGAWQLITVIAGRIWAPMPVKGEGRVMEPA